MKECMSEVVAFGMNEAELTIIMAASILILFIISFISFVMYVNTGIGETKEERWERKKPFQAIIDRKYN